MVCSAVTVTVVVVVGGGGLERETTWARHSPYSDVKLLLSCISSSRDFLSLSTSSFSDCTSLLNASITTIRVGRISVFSSRKRERQLKT